MTTRTYTQKDGSVWEWEETPSVLEYITKMHQNNVRNTAGGKQNPKEKGKES